MPFFGKYIAACIDGTDSHEWRKADGSNSHVRQFCSNIDTQQGTSLYWNGPGELMGGTVFGRGSTATVDGVTNQVNAKINQVLGTQLRRPFTSYPEPTKKKIRERYKRKLRVVMVGHSRGGLIAICAAARLVLPVYWLGLYDAVDMHPTLSGDIIHNVDYTAHAMRSPDLGSRSSWGNCGMKSSGEYVQKYFLTSHGGIGGDPVLNPDGMAADYSCMQGTLKDNISAIIGQRISEGCLIHSENANIWVLRQARVQGIKV